MNRLLLSIIVGYRIDEMGLELGSINIGVKKDDNAEKTANPSNFCFVYSLFTTTFVGLAQSADRANRLGLRFSMDGLLSFDLYCQTSLLVGGGGVLGVSHAGKSMHVYIG